MKLQDIISRTLQNQIISVYDYYACTHIIDIKGKTENCEWGEATVDAIFGSEKKNTIIVAIRED